jgi:hypothetical protein
VIVSSFVVVWENKIRKEKRKGNEKREKLGVTWV